MNAERYAMFEDYFGLSSVACGHKALDSLMSPPACSLGLTDELVGLSRGQVLGLALPGAAGLSPEDPLHTVRSTAYEDFLRNGVSTDMDELDQYQAELRKRTASRTSRIQPGHGEARAGKRNRKLKKLCVFCKNNNEPASLYQSHILKDVNGTVTCPVLRNYTCPLCGASGDVAHTIRYCPRNSPGDIHTAK